MKKIAKLSLVAAVAVAGFTTANAQPLEEAIKNVDVSGSVVYRYDNFDDDKKLTNNNTEKNNYKVALNLASKINEDVKFNSRFLVANENGDFKAASVPHKLSLSPYFGNQLIVSETHKNYEKFSQYMAEIGIKHQRLLCYDFKLEDDDSIAHVYFYDDKDTRFTSKQQALLEELSSGLVTILARKSESQDYYELYEQERALNFSKTKFFQVIAHDLRAPFHGLIGFSDVLANERETLSDDGIQDIADYIGITRSYLFHLFNKNLKMSPQQIGRAHV